MLTIFLLIVMLVCVAMCWNEGLWGNAITLVNVLLAAMIAGAAGNDATSLVVGTLTSPTGGATATGDGSLANQPFNPPKKYNVAATSNSAAKPNSSPRNRAQPDARKYSGISACRAGVVD